MAGPSNCSMCFIKIIEYSSTEYPLQILCAYVCSLKEGNVRCYRHREAQGNKTTGTEHLSMARPVLKYFGGDGGSGDALEVPRDFVREVFLNHHPFWLSTPGIFGLQRAARLPTTHPAVHSGNARTGTAGYFPGRHSCQP